MASHRIYLSLNFLLLLSVFDRRLVPVPLADAVLRAKSLLERDHPFKKVREGDVNIGLLVSVHDDDPDNDGRCSELLPAGVIRSQARTCAVNQINRRQDLLPNVTIGYVQMDDCWNDLKALEVAVYLVGDDGSECSNVTAIGGDDIIFRSYDVVGVLGPSNSAMSVAVSKFLPT